MINDKREDRGIEGKKISLFDDNLCSWRRDWNKWDMSIQEQRVI